MPKLSLQLLGGFRLAGPKDRAVPVRSRKAQALLAYLALNPGPQGREKLATLLWGDRMDEQARHSLRQTLSTLRKALGEGDGEPLAADADTAGLADGALEVDALAFAEGAGAESPEALQEAAQRYAGPLLEGFGSVAEEFDGWLAGERERLHALAGQALEKLAEHQEQAGETEAAAATAQRLLALHPAREEGHRLLMRLHAATGRRAEALKQYTACVEALRRELDAEPSPETTRLYERIRDGISEAAPPVPSAPQPPPAPAVPVPPPDKPSIAVLPFENMSGDPEQEYFSDGLAEDIITDLFHISGLHVIARQTSFSYKGTSAAVREIGRELGVEHVLEGSVRKSGNRVRITAQLVETESGHQVWAERYDRTLEDLFAVQDEITEEVVAALDVKLREGEQAREWRKSTTNPEAYYLHLQARNEWVRFLGRVSLYRGRQLWEMALEKDPKFSRACAAIGGSHICEAIWGFSQDPEQSMKRSLAYIQRALEMDGPNSYAYTCRGMYHLYRREYDRSLADTEKAVSLNPLGADVTFFHARALLFCGEARLALDSIRKGMRLTPDPPAWFLTDEGHGYLLLEDYEKSLAPFEASARLAPEYMFNRVLLVGAHAALGQENERKREVGEALRLEPKFSLAEWAGRELPYRDPADLERMVALLGKAGLPE